MPFTNPFSKSRLTRRGDLRRLDVGGPRKWLEHLRVSGATLPLLIALVFCGSALCIVLSGEERLPWVPDQTVDTPIVARIDFDRLNETKTTQTLEAAQRATPNYFRFNKPLIERVTGDLRALQTDVRAAESYEKFNESSKGRWKLSQAGYDAVRKLSDSEGAAKYDRWVNGLMNGLSGERLVQRPTAAERDSQRETAEDAILVNAEGQDVRVSKQRLSYASNEQHVVRLAKELAEGFPNSLREAVTQIVVQAIRVDPAKDRYEPVYVFDNGATQAALESAKGIPPVYDHYKRGAVLVPAGSTLTPELLVLVSREHSRYLEVRQSSVELYRPWLYKRLGQSGLVILIILGLSLYTQRYQPRLVAQPVHCLSLATLLLSMMLASRLLVAGSWSELWTLAPMTTAAAILTIVYSHRFAFGVSAALATLIALTLNASFELFLVMMAVATTVSFTLGDIRSRMRLIYVGAWTGAAAGVMAALVGLSQQQAPGFVAGQAGVAAGAAFLACCVVLVLLPVIEKIFRLATSMTLLEWADTSTPLLKQLIQKAPGTWQHSHLLGSMAEAAADEIGANGLLVRVGAYYHDIGKMCKPEYFVENQPGQTSAHSRLAPRMSLLVILGHIKDGLALAEEYHLPKILHQFIAEHHGTTLVRYFHAMAAQYDAARGRFRDDRPPDESEFRYPGPRPHTKEAAILMLCDGVEGAVRSLPEPNPSRIEAVVHEIVMERLMDGQLDDCDISLKDLARVEQSLIKSLCSIYHGRIAYPKTPQPQSQPLAATRTA